MGVDPFILGMMEKQRHKIKKLEMKLKEFKIKIKSQKKELKNTKIAIGANNPSEQLIENKEGKQYRIKIEQLNRIIGRLRKDNEELINKNSIDNNNSFEYQNKYNKLQSEYELLKLDYASVKKELNTQKNQNFWLMEDYNEIKVKYDNFGTSNHNKNETAINGKNSNEQIGNLLKELRKLREENRESEMLLVAADNKLKEYEVTINEYELEMKSLHRTHKEELDELMNGIKERDDQINEFRKESKLKEEHFIHQHK